MERLLVNENRINSSLIESCQWGSTPDGGMNRLSLNDDDKRVRQWFVEQTKLCGCMHKIDKMGNIFAIRPGQNNNLSPLGLGSHLDTQPAGGKYDGIVGVLSALEALRVLHENNIRTYAPIAVIDWTNEEGARFSPAVLASGVWSGAFDLDYAHSREDLQGVKFGDELRRIGFLGEIEASHKANPLSAHFEVHIEQGPVLQAEECPVAVVTGVQAMSWFNVVLRGREQHCGTTPMTMRGDTLLSAARMITAINAAALDTPGSVASVAVIKSSPQAINTLAGRVQFSIDVRAKDDEVLKVVEERIEEACKEVAKMENGAVKIETWDRFWTSEKILFDRTAVGAVRDAAKASGYGFRELQSGAGHDSAYTSRVCPTAMIFIRCKDGVSHNPAEYSSPGDIAAGAQVLLDSVLRYDNVLRTKHEM